MSRLSICSTFVTHSTGVLGLRVPRSECPPAMLIAHRDHTNTVQVYSVTVVTHAIALEGGRSSQGTSEPITPGFSVTSHWKFIWFSDENRSKVVIFIMISMHFFLINAHWVLWRMGAVTENPSSSCQRQLKMHTIKQYPQIICHLTYLMKYGSSPVFPFQGFSLQLE